MPTDLETSTDDEQTPDDSPIIRDLRKQAEQGKVEKDRADGLERKLALSEAGLTGLSEEQREAIAAVHKDEWNAEALKATAARLGFGATSTDGEQTTEPKIPDAELQAHQRVANAANGEQAVHLDVQSEEGLKAAILAVPEGPNTTEEIKALLRNAGKLIEHDD